jgi:epoxyqueuosine reductase
MAARGQVQNTMIDLAQRIRARACELGFDLVGIAPAMPSPDLRLYREWIAHGYHGEMDYLVRPDRIARREDPRLILPGVRSIVSVGMNYYTGELPERLPSDPARAVISRYAWGRDYHKLLLARLEQLAGWVREIRGPAVGHRAYVDTGPILERSIAIRAGLGFSGKNTCLIHPQLGSWLFLGELVLDVELAPSTPISHMGCGSCRRCLDACPTGALVAPHILDARRCISYLTIELREAIPHDLRGLVGNRVFGCDTCQEVCPWQRFARPAEEPAFQAPVPERVAPLLLELIRLDSTAFRQRYRHTPVWRARRRGLLRNTAVALGNWGDPRAVPALAQALSDPEALVRDHAAWALGRIGTRAARQALVAACAQEEDPSSRSEIEMALTACR